jgi:hypothetical protein
MLTARTTSKRVSETEVANSDAWLHALSVVASAWNGNCSKTDCGMQRFLLKKHSVGSDFSSPT